MTIISPKLVLVLDDDQAIREAVTDVLRDALINVAAFATGAAALKHLQASRQRPDVILLDLLMPHMNGASFRVRLTMDARLASIPLVVMSATQDGDKAARVLGATGYLRKPFSPGELLQTIERAAVSVKAIATATPQANPITRRKPS